MCGFRCGAWGKDGGTFCGNVTEKDINLSVVLYLKEILEEAGVEVVLTRDSDESISLSERASIANEAETDFFVSVHCNYYEDDTNISGVECYYYPDAAAGKSSAEIILDMMKKNAFIAVREAKPEEFYVLRHTNVTAVLVEIGYLSNDSERQKLDSADYQEMLAQALAEGVLIHLEEGITS